MGDSPQLCQSPANLAEGLYSITTRGSSLPACLLERTEDWHAGRAQAACKTRVTRIQFVFDFGLFKKQKGKKKKIPTNNFIYKVKLKPQIMERGKNYGKRKKGEARANTTF